jgi:hypothetical protein
MQAVHVQKLSMSSKFQVRMLGLKARPDEAGTERRDLSARQSVIPTGAMFKAQFNTFQLPDHSAA